MNFLKWLGKVVGGFAVSLILLVLLFAAIFRPDAPPTVDEGVALVISPRGALVEEKSGDPVGRALNKLQGREKPETVVTDLIDAIDKAASDDRIKALVLDTKKLAGGGLSKLQEVGAAIRTFREESKKPVIAISDGYTQEQYYLAAMADEVYMHPQGFVLLTGYGRYKNYYKEAIEKLKIDWNVFRVGKYKSFVEPYIRNDMSEAAKEASREFLDDLWQGYLTDVGAARGRTPEELDAMVNDFVDNLATADGDLAELAKQSGLVDELATRDKMRQRVIDIVGEDDEHHSFRQISHHDYLEALEAENGLHPQGDKRVGVVVASGSIVDGKQPPGTVGGDTLAKLLRDARHDDNVKAVVLRVDSPGGSAFASDVILREVELLKEAGKPVVVSMSSVAASGGYWISMAADEIWASPTTITGSIGILGMFPTFQDSLDAIGIHADGVGTTNMSNAFRPDMAMEDHVKRGFQLMIEHGYRDFITNVAEHRDMSVERVDELGQGRVWSGQDAHERGLVDKLGGFRDAVASAAARAELGEDYGVEFIKQELSPFQQFMRNLGGNGAAQALVPDIPGSGLPAAGPGGGARRVIENLMGDLDTFSKFNDPSGLYYYCFCEIR